MPRTRTLVICFGRFNPPTTGHEALLQFALKTAQRRGADLRVYPSQSQDAKKNPLPFAEKVKFLKTLFPHISFNDNTAIHTPIQALGAAASAKYTDVIAIVGSDRVDEFMRFQNYIVPASSPRFRKDAHIPLNSYEVISVPVIRGGGSGVAGMSASKQRAFAVAGDYESFKQGVPGQNDRIARAMYTAVRKHMNINESEWLRAQIDRDTLRLPLVERDTLGGKRITEAEVTCADCGVSLTAKEKKKASGTCDACDLDYKDKQDRKRMDEADYRPAKPPSEVQRLKTRQKQDEIALKQRQANELMAAKLRDVQQKSREQQAKANAPKGAATPASR